MMHPEIRYYWEQQGRIQTWYPDRYNFWSKGHWIKDVFDGTGGLKLYRFESQGKQYTEEEALRMIKLKAFM